MILLDTSGLLSAIDASHDAHATAKTALKTAGVGVLSPFVLAELDYMLSARVGRAAEMALLAEVASGAYRLEPFSADDVASARAVIEQYGDLDPGLADASIVVLARRYGIVDVLTLDERHFRAMAGPHGKPFRILPADA